MKYFNIRYECIDARDEFSAQRDDERSKGLWCHWATEELLSDLDHMKNECDYTGEYVDDEVAYDGDMLDMVGRKTMIK